jgi:hypothetical protein
MRRRRRGRIEKVALYLNEVGKTVNARRRRMLRRARRALQKKFGVRARSASAGV